MWIYRDISAILEENQDPIQIIRGPRQCGKSSLIYKLDPSYKELSLDDPSLRELAQNDPELFLKQFSAEKLFIDEAQYAPNLFPSLKRKIDLYKRGNNGKMQTIVRLTGSNQILMDKHIKETLAGRASYFDMNTLSVAEILMHQKYSIQEILYRGGWPELYANPDKDEKRYLDTYINTYIEKDIVLSAGIQKQNEFFKFIKLLAGRIGQLLDLTSFSNDCSVDIKTIKQWLSVLESMKIIYLLQPYSHNLTNRLTKSPKVYFIDTGLACRLQGWTSADPILTSPMQGHLFENLVFSEVYKLNINYDLRWNLFHWRSRAGEEIDFLVQKSKNEFVFVEAKVSSTSRYAIESFPEVKKVFSNNVPNFYICHEEGENVLAHNVPIRLLKETLLK